MTAWGLALAGFVALSLSLERHHEQAFAQRRIPPWRWRGLRGGGWLLLAASLAPPVWQSGWGEGLVLWTGLLTAAALPPVVLLTYRPRWMPAAGAVALGVALLGGVAP